MKKHLSTILLILVFFVGLGILLYPSISNYINEKHQSTVIIAYDESLKHMTEGEFERLLKGAEEYNNRLKNDIMGFYDTDKIDGYHDVLNVNGTGVMGYIVIPKINVSLPIYHGTSDSVLKHSAGHLEGTSLPIGGEGTHSVISAHRGLPSAKLFTNLDKLQVGDQFIINVLNRTLTYEVDQIKIVLPEETAALLPIKGEDHCTLLTCTPYGINTHRLFVRGVRVENEEIQGEERVLVTADAFVIDPLIVTPIVATPMLLVAIIILFIKTQKRRKEK